MGEAALDAHHHRLVIDVGDDRPLQNTFWHWVRSLLRRGLLAEYGLDPRDLAADRPYPGGRLQLLGSALETQVELFLLQADQLILQLVRCLGAQVGGVVATCGLGLCLLGLGCHVPQSAMRVMTRVVIGSFMAPRRSASLAISSGTPSISNRIRPGLTRAVQYSTAPLPLPMRTSVGFLETGRSGKMRIHTRPARFISRVMARRAASIWRAVTRSGSWALRPNWPKARSTPPLAAPWIRPLCALRNLVRFGCSILYSLLSLQPAGDAG